MKTLAQAWLVILISLCCGAALAGIQATLATRIEENKLAETLEQIPKLVPGANEGVAITIAGQKVYRGLKDGEMVGWVIPATGQGFADQIEVLIGLNTNATRITGLYVIDQKETPGLGNKITEEVWANQFTNKNTSPALQITRISPKNEFEILAITGATISSESVCEIVNNTLAKMQPELSAFK